MGSGGRSALIYNTVVALAGAAVMFALVLSGISEPSAVDDRAAARRWPAKTLPSTDRLAFVPPGIWSPSKTLPIDIAEPTAGNAAKSDNAGAWSTKIQPEAAIQPSDIPYSGWRFTLQPAFRSPSQLAKPAPPQRTATLKARLAEISPAATMRLAAKFEAAKATWPPAEIALVAIKDE